MGKSTAEHSLRQRGVPVVDTDVIARQIVEPGRPAFQEIKSAFGPEVIGLDGRLRREDLARIVFANREARQKLESITHPRIRELWKRQLDAWRLEGHSLAVVAIPLLFETGAESELDVVVCVACSAATQRQRLRERGWDDRQIAARIAAQWPVESKMIRADYIVWTEGSFELLEGQLDRIFKT